MKTTAHLISEKYHTAYEAILSVADALSNAGLAREADKQRENAEQFKAARDLMASLSHPAPSPQAEVAK